MNNFVIELNGQIALLGKKSALSVNGLESVGRDGGRAMFKQAYVERKFFCHLPTGGFVPQRGIIHLYGLHPPFARN